MHGVVDIREPRRTLVAIAALAITLWLIRAAQTLWSVPYVPDWLAMVAGILQFLNPILSLALLGLIGPRLWRAGGRSRAVGIGALVAAFVVSAWTLTVLLANFGLPVH